jgi:hypothetical protein
MSWLPQIRRAYFSASTLMLGVVLLSLWLATGIDRKPVRSDDPLERDPPDDAWQAFWLPKLDPLANIPAIVSTEEMLDSKGRRNGYRVTVRNTGTTTLRYSGVSPEWMDQYIESREFGKWKQLSWSGMCDVGTPRQSFEMEPNESVKFYVRKASLDKRERVFARFYEGTNRAGLVLLATEPAVP